MACRWQPGMKITALLDALNSALAEPFALAWSQDSPRFLLVFTVIYAVVLIVAVSDQKNTRPGAEHGSAAWGDVFRLNKFYMDKRGPNLLLTQHCHIGIDGYKHKHNTNILIVGGSGAGKTRTYGVPNVLECACSMVITDPKAEILRKTGNLLKQKGYEVMLNYFITNVIHISTANIPWLDTRAGGMFVLILLGIWKGVGWNMVVFLAALQSVPQELYESAEMDGCGSIAKFFYITIPCIKSTILFALVMLTIGGFNAFTSIKMITGGKPMHKTETVLTWMYYKAFNAGEFGYAAALSFIVAVTLILLAILQFKAMQQGDSVE